MEIIKNFGLDPIMLVAQIVNFLIVLFLLKRFLYKPVLETLKKREDTIKEGLKQAEEGRLVLEKSLEEERKILRKAQDQARKILEDARAQSDQIGKQLEDESRLRAEKILTDAQSQISQETREAEKRLAERINQLSIDLLTKSVKEMFDEKEEKLIINRALKKIKKAD